MAKVIIKSAFGLITDDHRRFEFAAGEQDIPDELADHWYVRAHCEPFPEAYDIPDIAPADEAVAEPPAVEKRKPGRPRNP